jgi:hypothetical protein
MEDLILLDISNQSLLCILEYDNFKTDNMLSNNESLKIYPSYFILQICMKYLFYPLIYLLDNLEKNVCFLDINVNKIFLINKLSHGYILPF